MNKALFYIKGILLLIVFSSIGNQCFSQTKYIDSLSLVLNTQKKKRDTARVNCLYDLAMACVQIGDEKSKIYHRQTKELSDSLNYTLGKAKAAYLSGIFESQKSNYTQSLAYFNQSEKYYQQLNDKKGLAGVYMAYGITHTMQAQYDEANEDYIRASQMYEEVGDEENVLRTLTNLANLYMKQGNYNRANSIYNRLIEKYELLNDEAGIISNVYNQALIFKLQGNYPLAINQFNKTLVYYEKLGDTIMIARVFNNIGDLYLSFEKFDLAKEYFVKSIKLLELKGNQREVGGGHLNLGSLYSALGEVDSAIYHLNISLDAANKHNSPEGIVFSLINLGREYQVKNDLERALDYFNKSNKLSDSIGYVRGVCTAQVYIGEIYLEQKKYDLAFDLAEAGVKTAKRLGLLNIQKKALRIIQEVYQKRGDFEKALYVYQEYKVLSDSLFNKEKIEKVAQVEYEYLYQHQLDSAKIRELNLTKTVSDTNKNLEKSQRNLLWAIISILGIVLIGAIVIFALRVRNLNAKSQMILTEQRLLRSQMTPHFIFNSLSVLQGMILNNEGNKSINYLSKFSRLLRITLENSRDKMVVLEQELLAVKNYLALQNLEDENYVYEVKVDEAIVETSYLIPPMLIQPFIENSIEHGFKNQLGVKNINVQLDLIQNQLICKVIDNGVGIDANLSSKNSKKQSLATKITSERLKMLSKEFNMDGSVTIEDRKKYDEKGTIVTLVIPYKKEIGI